MAKRYEVILQEEIVKRGMAQKSVAEAMMNEAAKTGESFISILTRHSISSEKELLSILADKLKLSIIDLKTVEADPQAVGRVPIKLASYYKMLPLKIEGRVLKIAVSYPFDVKTLDDIRMQIGYDVSMALAPSVDIEEGIRNGYGVGAETIDQIISKAPLSDKAARQVVIEEEKIEDIEKEAGDISVIRLVNQLILEAYRKRATDIHIEPYRGKVSFRYRIDGVLYDVNVPTEVKNFLQPILSRIKIMSNLNIVERRLPQDGRAIVKVHDNTLDLRISSIPTPFGESVVIRILPTTMFFDLVKLGLSEDQLDKFNTFIKRPHGIIFVTGPTGSGKTTTLYACLSKINTREKKIITIEDPIEYEVSGITQIQVANEIGLDFARGLRSMLRHDPDVMMVGEVRDIETAEIAIRVALTGHLVFSTLHTNDASSGITRLIEIGVEPYLVSSSVIAFVAQRLIRVICPDCKKEDTDCPIEIKEMILRELKLNKSPNDIKIYKGTGCPGCNSTGYFGRTAIYEILTVNDVIRELVMKSAPATEIRKAAVRDGMRLLRQDGWMNVLRGITTPDEILRVTQKDDTSQAGENRGVAPEVEALPKSGPEDDLSSIPGEKRIYMRLDERINVRFTIHRSPVKKDMFGKEEINPEQLSTTKNISAGGVLFISNEAPPVDAILDLTLEVPGRHDPITCLAKVIRVETAEAKKLYDVAVFFLGISSKDRAYLDKYVHEEKKAR